MPNEKVFSIDGTDYIVDEFCIAQDEYLTRILKDTGAIHVIMMGGLNIEKLLDGIIEGKKLREFMALCLIKKGIPFDEQAFLDRDLSWGGQIKNSMAMDIIDEFRKKNESSMKRLEDLLPEVEQQKPETKKEAEPTKM